MSYNYRKSSNAIAGSRTQVTRRRLLSGAAATGAGLAALALTGCGDDDDVDNGTVDETREPEPSGATATASPKKGGTFEWQIEWPSMYAKPSGPPHITGGSSLGVYWMTNQAVRLSADAGQILPELFESWEMIDSMNYVAKVRPEVKTADGPLTNGRVFDAEDVVVNLKWITGLADPTNAAKFVNKTLLPNVSSVQAVDPSTVRVTFSQPSLFPHGLTSVRLGMYPRELFEPGLSDPAMEASTGPWTIEHFEPDRVIEFKAASTAWDGPAPYFDRFVMRRSADRVSQMASFLQGNADYFENPSAVERQTILGQMKDAQLFQWPGSTAVSWGFQTERPPFSDRRVRQALHLVTPYNQDLTDYWGKGFVTLCGVLSNAYAEALSMDEVLQLPGWRTDKDQDIKKANELLTAAGFPGGSGLKVVYMTSDQAWATPYGGDFAIRQMDAWRKAFKDITISTKPTGDRAAHESELKKGDFDVSHLILPGSFPVANHLARVHGTGGNLNFPKYSNERIDAIAKAGQDPATDPADAAKQIREAENILMEDVPQVVMYRLHQGAFFSPRVRGFPTLPGGASPIAGSFESWITALRHVRSLWFENS